MKPKRIYLNRVEGDGSDKIWSEEPVSVCDYVQNGEYINLSEVWRDASEEPKDNSQILYQDRLGVCWTALRQERFEYDWDWERFAFAHLMLRWAYISDLLPKQFGNSKQVKGGEQ